MDGGGEKGEYLREGYAAVVEAGSFDALVPVCFKGFCAEVAHYGEGEVEHGAHGYGEVDDDLVQ